MKNIALIVIANLSFALSGSAQTLDVQNILPPTSPTAAGLTRYVDYPVSFSSGLPDITVPLVEFRSSRITVPLSLSYHAGGIKVTDRSSAVGIGFSLNAGGLIGRSIVGNPDEGADGLNYPDSLSEFYNGKYFRYLAPDHAFNDIFCFVNRTYNTVVNNGQNDDSGPDNYYYNVQGLSGKFTYGKGKQFVANPYAPIAIQYDAFKGAPYKIKNTDGVTYEFGSFSPDGNSPSIDYVDHGKGKKISAWYLTKIISADKSDTVIVKYSPIHDKFVNFRLQSQLNDPRPFNNVGQGEVTVQRALSQSTEYNAKITEIVSRNGRVKFNYALDNATYRYKSTDFNTYDITQQIPVLQSIDIYSGPAGKEILIKSFIFSYSNFQTNPAKAPNSLRLDRVQEISNDGESTSYSFTYDSNPVPPYNTNGCDIWGYYNGRDSNEDMLLVGKRAGRDEFDRFYTAENRFEKREGNPGYINYGTLQSIKYPTGGTTSFVFEPNQMETTESTSGNGVYVSAQINTPDKAGAHGSNVVFTPASGGSVTRTLTFSGSNNCTSGSNCTVNQPQVILKNLTTGAVVIDKTLTISIGINGVPLLERFEQTLPPLDPAHQYQLYLPDPGEFRSGKSLKYTMSATLTENVVNAGSVTRMVYGGGRRVNRIVHSDGTGNKTVKSYHYTKPYFNSNIFTGKLDRLSAAMSHSRYMIDASTNPTNPVYTSSNVIDGVVDPVLMGITHYEALPYAVGSPNSSISYREVEETLTDGTGVSLGKSVFTFNTGIDYVQNWVLTHKLDRSFIRSQLINKKIFKNVASGVQLVRETENVYNNMNDLPLDVKGSEFIRRYAASFDDGDPRHTSSPDFFAAHPSCTDYLFRAPISFSTIYENIVRPTLISTKEKEMTSSGDSVVTITDYTYGNLKHMKPTRIFTSRSNGIGVIQDIRYSADINIPFTPGNAYLANPIPSLFGTVSPLLNGILNLQLENNIVALEKSISITKPDDGGSYLTFSSFNHFHPILPVVDSISVIETTSLIADFKPANIFLQPRVRYNVDVPILDHRYVTRMNMRYGANGNLLEQWQPGSMNKVYLWGYKGLCPIAEIQNSTYHDVLTKLGGQVVVDQLNSISVTDEFITQKMNALRTALPNAQITSYTYKPLVGMTSRTDAKGMTEYYHYDGFLRLQHVLDQVKQVRQRYDYHYRP